MTERERNTEQPEITQEDVNEVEKIMDQVEAELVDAIFSQENLSDDFSIDDNMDG